jgi:hypothetical protein
MPCLLQMTPGHLKVGRFAQGALQELVLSLPSPSFSGLQLLKMLVEATVRCPHSDTISII